MPAGCCARPVARRRRSRPTGGSGKRSRNPGQESADALRSVRGQFDARGWHEQAGKVHLHLAHALAHLGERAEAAAEYRAALALEDRRPAPPTWFGQ
ncbi:hypothetical protein ACH4E5_23025 [Streptomyces afghaniensis]|uniref:hypothetical protein n=1 Tax=Streptomyces afghaniensis TaxID=66865 RepID=UPI00379DDD38